MEAPMLETPPLRSSTRFVALDVHRHYVVVGAVDAQQTVVLTPRRFGFAAFASWASDHLSPTDAVVLEASSNAWLLHDQLAPLVASVTVAHPRRLVQKRTQARNRLHAVLHRHNLTVPDGKPLAEHQRDWWLALDLAPSAQVRLRQ